MEPPKPSPASSEKPKPNPKLEEASVYTDNNGAAPPPPPKRPNFQRFWSDGDEVAILNGIIDYSSKSGASPTSPDMDALYEFMKKKSHRVAEASRSQLAEKVRRLKKKFTDASARAKKGAEPSFAQPHEKALYDLSKKIWAASVVSADTIGAKTERGSAVTPRATKFKVKEADEDGDSMDVKFAYPLLCEAIMKEKEVLRTPRLKRRLELVDGSKAMQLEEKHKKLMVAETKYQLRKMDLRKETIKQILEAIE